MNKLRDSVSPTTFYAYLKAILMSFEGEKIERKAKEILSALRAIQKDYGNVSSYLSTLQRHFNNASNMLNNVLTGFSQLDQRLEKTHLLGESDKKTYRIRLNIFSAGAFQEAFV